MDLILDFFLLFRFFFQYLNVYLNVPRSNLIELHRLLYYFVFYSLYKIFIKYSILFKIIRTFFSFFTQMLTLICWKESKMNRE